MTDTAPKTEWQRPADFQERLDRVNKQLPSPAAYASMGRDELIASMEQRLESLHNEFPDMPQCGVDGEACGVGTDKWYVPAVDYGQAIQTLDEETQKKLSASTMRIYQSLFDPVTADEVHRELKELLAGKYPEIWKLTEDTVFGKQEAWPKLKEFALKQIAEGRGNPFLPENAGRIFAPSVPAAEETK